MLSAAILPLHEAYCSRNFVKCPDCGDFFDKTSDFSHKKLHEQVISRVFSEIPRFSGGMRALPRQFPGKRPRNARENLRKPAKNLRILQNPVRNQGIRRTLLRVRQSHAIMRDLREIHQIIGTSLPWNSLFAGKKRGNREKSRFFFEKHEKFTKNSEFRGVLLDF